MNDIRLWLCSAPPLYPGPQTTITLQQQTVNILPPLLLLCVVIDIKNNNNI